MVSMFFDFRELPGVDSRFNPSGSNRILFNQCWGEVRGLPFSWFWAIQPMPEGGPGPRATGPYWAQARRPLGLGPTRPEGHLAHARGRPRPEGHWA